MKYDTFLLDADDTVFDFQKAAAHALKAAFEECGIKYKEEYRRVYMRVNDNLWKMLERREITKEQLLERRFSSVLKELEIDFDDKVINEAYVKNLGLRSDYIDGAHEFLSELKRFGRIYIITNGTYSVQVERCKRFGMEKYISGMFVSEKVGYNKPDIRFMDYVFSHIPDFNPLNTVVIGDGLTSDMAAAERSGIDGIWFNPSHKLNDKGIRITYEAESYADVLRIIGND